jgi:TPP-dependent pyruvate/acetoin dehydrogenase alpha subunit
VRAGVGPVLLKAKTYRFSGHLKSDNELYRSSEEVSGWRNRDPLVISREKLLGDGVTPEEVEGIDPASVEQITAALESARNSADAGLVRQRARPDRDVVGTGTGVVDDLEAGTLAVRVPARRGEVSATRLEHCVTKILHLRRLRAVSDWQDSA